MTDTVLNICFDRLCEGLQVIGPDRVHRLGVAVDAIAFFELCCRQTHEGTEAEPDGLDQFEQDAARPRLIQGAVKQEVELRRAEQIIGAIGLVDLRIDHLQPLQPCLVDMGQRPHGRERFQGGAGGDDLLEFREGHFRHADAAIVEIFQRTIRDQAMQGLAHGHGAYPEVIGDAVDGDRQTRGDRARHDTGPQRPIDALLA